MEAFINDFFEYIQQAAKPILFLVFVFFVTVAIRMIQEARRNKYFDKTELAKKYMVAHGMACGFVFIYSCILYFIPKNESGVAAFLMLMLFYRYFCFAYAK